ncbi:MAG: class I SAM-dependent methyltransferase [Campylobacterales bacterium]|nr:class I SAM-dependent methyltransferase [Campylobacterales bacterium]HEO98810.1 class I SAM-dependent methyltransferase [Campylobacterota bacterium]
MPRTEAFEAYYEEYETWFETHSKLYEAEIKTIQKLLLPFEHGVEIGIGSGRFALPLGIKTGVEPSGKMAKIAQSKGIEVIEGVAEKLPLKDERYDFVLMVTTICFVDDALQSLKEIYRILKPGGFVIIGFVDRHSELGKLYEKNRRESRFYKEATFFSAKEVIGLLEKSGFEEISSCQTLFGKTLEDVKTDIKEGHDEGAFVAIRGVKESSSRKG